MVKKIFISYSDNDRNKMRSIEKLISNHNLLKAIIVADNRNALELLSTKVKAGIESCDYFVPILTEQSICTQWINQEIGYATALKKEIIPIVQTQIMSELRGFIHKQLDLSYGFEGNTKSKLSEASKFTRKAKVLIDDILIKNHQIPKDVTIESAFPGIWESEYILRGTKTFERQIEIKDKRYFTEDVHWFDLEDIYIDLQKGKIKFKKEGLRNDNRQVFNDLDIVEFGKEYKGVEIDKEDNNIPIKYYRVG